MPTTTKPKPDEQVRDELPPDDDEQNDELEQAEEPAEPTEPAEPGDEPETDPAAGLEEPTDQMWTELFVVRDEYVDAVRAIMGSFVGGLELCEACNGTALAPPAPPKLKLEQKEGTLECPVCKGAGELGLPTKRDGFEVEGCGHCSGKGWIGPGNLPPVEAARIAAAVATGDVLPETAPVQPAAPATTDPRVAELRAAGYVVVEPPGR